MRRFHVKYVFTLWAHLTGCFVDIYVSHLMKLSTLAVAAVRALTFAEETVLSWKPVAM